jgi:hypothetical protein
MALPERSFAQVLQISSANSRENIAWAVELMSEILSRTSQ